MAIEKKDVNDFQKQIDGLIGQKVLLRGSLGRNKFFEKEAELIGTTKEKFLVKYDSMIKENFNIVDVLGNRVEFCIKNNAGEYTSILENNEQKITL